MKLDTPHLAADLPGRGLFEAHAHVLAAARALAGGGERGLHAQLLNLAAVLRSREREAVTLAEPEDE